MSNRLFQTIIHQMKDVVGRTIGVIDENGISIAKLPLCGVTVWAEYCPEGENRYRLLDIYFHRMEQVEAPAEDTTAPER